MSTPRRTSRLALSAFALSLAGYALLAYGLSGIELLGGGASIGHPSPLRDSAIVASGAFFLTAMILALASLVRILRQSSQLRGSIFALAAIALAALPIHAYVVIADAFRKHGIG